MCVCMYIFTRFSPCMPLVRCLYSEHHCMVYPVRRKKGETVVISFLGMI